MLRITDTAEGPTHLYQDGRYTLNGADVMVSHPRGYVVSGGGDHHTKVWDPATLEVMHNFHAGTHHDIKALAVSHNGNFVASGHGSWGGVHLWDMDTGKLLWCQENLMYVEALAFDESDSTVVALSGDQYHIFDVQTGDQLAENDLNDSSDYQVIQQSARRFFVADEQNLTAFDAATGKPVWRLDDFTDGDEIENLKMLPGDHHLAVVHGKDRVTFVRTDDGALGQSLTLAMDDQRWQLDFPLAVSPDLQLLAIVTRTSQIRFYRTRDGSLVASHQIDGNLKLFESLLFTEDGNRLVVGNALGMTLVLGLERPETGADSPFDGTEWQRPNVSDFDRFILDNNLTIKAGYYHNDGFIEQIRSSDPDRLRYFVDMIRESGEGSGGNFSVILEAILGRAREHQEDLIAAEASILLIREGLPSAGAVIHDAWGMKAWCAEKGCAYLQTYPLDALSDDLQATLARNLERAIAINEELDDLGVPGLKDLESRLEHPGSK
ncbi:WD40 repeat domain-containing protein [Marinobacter sp. OP 3.4]|uniref:WD40 repeat domain-containing protein n=1 Tax=Marinobacter sp. OP 3.4 TaxID=3076501 RepID=UPI002E1C5C94